MVRSVLRAEHLIDLVTQEIVAKADGNPLFLEQLALHVGEARDLRSDLMVPDTIHNVVMARIDRLPDETKRLLQTAAVIGREFSLRLLNAVWKSSGRSKISCTSCAVSNSSTNALRPTGPFLSFATR
jgi:predicted ATPase